MELKIKNVRKEFQLKDNIFKRKILAVESISLDILDGEFVAILGPNACGKTTLLRMIAGLLKPDSGQILFDNKKSTIAQIGYVFQNYKDSLYPWKTVIDNIAFPFELAGVPLTERRARVKRFCETFNIDIDFNKYPYELSEGQKQLVALLRAFINKPDLLLMDEPFSALDYYTRIDMHFQLMKLLASRRVTTVFISHDIKEAIFLADRVVIFSKPAQVIATYNIGFPHPRTADTIKSEGFIKTEKKILETIFQEVHQ